MTTCPHWFTQYIENSVYHVEQTLYRTYKPDRGSLIGLTLAFVRKGTSRGEVSARYSHGAAFRDETFDLLGESAWLSAR